MALFLLPSFESSFPSTYAPRPDYVTYNSCPRQLHARLLFINNCVQCLSLNKRRKSREETRMGYRLMRMNCVILPCVYPLYLSSIIFCAPSISLYFITFFIHVLCTGSVTLSTLFLIKQLNSSIVFRKTSLCHITFSVTVVSTISLLTCTNHCTLFWGDY